MKLFWRGSWMEAPGFNTPESAVLIEVESALALLALENASGRPTRRPRRKALVFLMTDGPRSTIRKARTKRDEPLYTGDLHVAIILGRAFPAMRRVVALAARVPPSAEQLPVHRSLVREVGDAFSASDFECLADALMDSEETLARLSRQNYLYSGMEPPDELVELWNEGLSRKKTHTANRLSRLTPPIQPPLGSAEPAETILRFARTETSSRMPVALLGAGDHARTEIIPALREAGLSLFVVADRDPQIAAIVGRNNDFVLATTDPERAIAELPRPGIVVVATAHDSHTDLACLAAEAGHRVFLEKPPTVTPKDVTRLADLMMARPGMVEIGFNRRYHPLVRRAQARLLRESGPTSITCTVKELSLFPDHWYFWANQGTRITGNLCHWIDLAVFLADGRPLPVSLTLSPRVVGSVTNDVERVLTITFDDGSLLTVLGTSRGDDIRGVQEQMDIRRGHTTITIDDLWKLRVLSGGLERYSRTTFRNKAHAPMYREALGRMVLGQPSIYPVGDMVLVSAIQIAASELVRNGEQICELPSWLSPLLREVDIDLRAHRAAGILGPEGIA